MGRGRRVTVDRSNENGVSALGPAHGLPEQPDSAMDDPILRGLLDYWRNLGASIGRLPCRNEIDPVVIPRNLLRHLLLIEREVDGADRHFRYRLMGTAVVDGVGLDATGHRLADLVKNQEYVARIQGNMEIALRNLCPVFSEGVIRSGDRYGVTRRTRRLSLPILKRPEDSGPSMILAGQTFPAGKPSDPAISLHPNINNYSHQTVFVLSVF